MSQFLVKFWINDLDNYMKLFFKWLVAASMHNSAALTLAFSWAVSLAW